MSILSWNCRGLGQPQTIQGLVRLIHTTSPKIVFLSETRQHRDRVSNIKGRLGMDNCLVVDGVGKGGGLALYWNDEVKISNLKNLGWALRVRWLWLQKTEPHRPWPSLSIQVPNQVRVIFAMAITSEVGNGEHALFWIDHWLQGQKF
jgi:hypothetical protein